MKVNIERAIKSITEKIDFYQPLYEGVINSFQADATEIKIKFDVKDGHVIGYAITDNGVGYDNENIEGFLTLWSNHKIDKFALGSGRILCLKVFDEIIIDSQTKNSTTNLGQKVHITFNRDFQANSIDDIDVIESDANASYTITKFENVNADYQMQYDREKEVFKLDRLKETFFIRLLPMFIGFEESGKEFSIFINDVEWLNKMNLKNEFTKKKFLTETFFIEKDMLSFENSDDLGNPKQTDMRQFGFNLKYRIMKDPQNTIEQFYGAADRYITTFSKGVAISKLEKGYSGIFCLTSDYFNTRVKDSRNAFVIGFNQSNPTKENPISFPEIHKELSKILTKILRENFKNIDKEVAIKKENIVRSFPHLARYIDKIDNLTLSETEMLKLSEKAFFDETKNVRNELQNFTEKLKKNKNNFDEKKYQEITQQFTIVGREQLADYIGYRQTIIDMLLEIYDETQQDSSRFDEKDIHSLFMPMSETSNTVFNYANNVWIFDDKFMSYNYAASDTTIEQIVKDVEGIDTEVDKDAKYKKPDLVMFYSNPEDEYKDILLIEFKRLNDGIDGKAKAINQINRYPMYIEEHVDKIRSIYTYTILDIDDAFIKDLKKVHLFQENAFGNSDNKITAYYKYNPEVKAHINVVSFSQVLADANKRNKVFLDILIQNFKNK